VRWQTFQPAAPLTAVTVAVYRFGLSDATARYVTEAVTGLCMTTLRTPKLTMWAPLPFAAARGASLAHTASLIASASRVLYASNRAATASRGLAKWAGRPTDALEGLPVLSPAVDDAQPARIKHASDAAVAVARLKPLTLARLDGDRPVSRVYSAGECS
jgi:hypothetical protein